MILTIARLFHRYKTSDARKRDGVQLVKCGTDTNLPDDHIVYQGGVKKRAATLIRLNGGCYDQHALKAIGLRFDGARVTVEWDGLRVVSIEKGLASQPGTRVIYTEDDAYTVGRDEMVYIRKGNRDQEE